MYFFEYIYNSRFGPYFINLQEYLPKEHIDIYSEGITPQLCVFNDKWVSLVNILYLLYIYIYIYLFIYLFIYLKILKELYIYTYNN